MEDLMADATTVFSQGVSMLSTFASSGGVTILDLIIVFAGGSAALFLVGRAINVAR